MTDILTAQPVISILLLCAATIFWLGVVIFVVRLTEMTRSIFAIKLVHSVVFFILSALLLAFVYEVIADRTSLISWAGATLFLAEGIVLLLNGWRCPLTSIAEKLGDAHGQITDTFLPKWFADRVFKFYGVLFVAGMALFLFRILA